MRTKTLSAKNLYLALKFEVNDETLEDKTARIANGKWVVVKKQVFPHRYFDINTKERFTFFQIQDSFLYAHQNEQTDPDEFKPLYTGLTQIETKPLSEKYGKRLTLEKIYKICKEKNEN